MNRQIFERDLPSVDGGYLHASRQVVAHRIRQLQIRSEREIHENRGDERFRDRADLEQRVLVRSPTRSLGGFPEALDDGLIAIDEADDDDAHILALAHFLANVLDELLLG